jgi:23S rRNA (cytidine1920-2'-O)/16S rRNA (cytidine1409-2'-O)-methyltransferase
VRSFEGVNARHIALGQFGDPFDIVVADLSFISLRLVLPALIPQICDGGHLILLIKPQFEVGKGQLGKKGIVKDRQLALSAADAICRAACDLGLGLQGLIECPIAGSDGNQEYLAEFIKQAM